jgi:hypothetical protein
VGRNQVFDCAVLAQCRFITFEEDAAVERVFAAGPMQELGGKRVEIKHATPKGAGSLGGSRTGGPDRGGGSGSGAGAGGVRGQGYGRAAPLPFGQVPGSPYGFSMYPYPPGGQLLGWQLLAHAHGDAALHCAALVLRWRPALGADACSMHACSSGRICSPCIAAWHGTPVDAVRCRDLEASACMRTTGKAASDLGPSKA